MADQKPMPILHMSVDTKNVRLTQDLTRKIADLAAFLKERYKDQYTIVFTTKDSPTIWTSDCNVVMLPLHDEDCIKNLLKILDEESWRPEEKKDDPS